MSFAQSVAARHHAEREAAAPKPAPFDASAALRQARAAGTPAHPWAEGFYAQAEHTGLPLATLNEIVRGSTTLAEAEGKVAQHVAAGEGSAALRKVAGNDVAAGISAAHAKAHTPRRPVAR